MIYLSIYQGFKISFSKGHGLNFTDLFVCIVCSLDYEKVALISIYIVRQVSEMGGVILYNISGKWSIMICEVKLLSTVQSRVKPGA